jgi:hypothetical protein
VDSIYDYTLSREPMPPASGYVHHINITYDTPSRYPLPAVDAYEYPSLVTPLVGPQSVGDAVGNRVCETYDSWCDRVCEELHAERASRSAVEADQPLIIELHTDPSTQRD